MEAAPTCPPTSRSSSPSRKNTPCGKGKEICPADVEARLDQYSENTQILVGTDQQGASIKKCKGKCHLDVQIWTHRILLEMFENHHFNV